MDRASVVLSLLVSCSLFQACGGGSNSDTGTNTSASTPQPQITIAAPADGSTVTSLPATIQLTFTNGADPAKMTALLDGVDITSQFSAADASGTRSVQVTQPAVNLGKNQIQVTDGSLIASVSFMVSLNGTGGPLTPSAT